MSAADTLKQDRAAACAPAEADEVIDAIAKTVAELTSRQDGMIRQQVIEQLMRQIMHRDGEFHREEATSAVGSQAKHWTAVRGDLSTGPIPPRPQPGQGGVALVVQKDRSQQVIEQLMGQIMHYDGEFRREEATSAVSSNAALATTRHRANSTPPPTWTMGGGLGCANRSSGVRRAPGAYYPL